MMLDRMVGIDTNSLIFLCEATDGDYDPSTDKDPVIAKERLSIFRVFIYTDYIRVPPTVKSEIRKEHQAQFCLAHLREIPLHNIDYNKVEELMTGYPLYNNDSRILVESIVGGCDSLLSYDKHLITKFKAKADIEILYPSEFWMRLALPKGSKPVLNPHWSNPKVTQHWYGW